MMVKVIDGITVLSPEDDYKFVSNDETWSTEVWLGTMDRVENWHDTNEEPQETAEPPEPED